MSKQSEAMARWRAEHPEQNRATQARAQAWRTARNRDARLNREELKARRQVRHYYQQREWKEKKRQATAYERAVARDSQLTNAEKAARRKVRKVFQRKAWALAHPERNRAFGRVERVRKYARKIGAQGHASADQIAARWAYYGHKCWMCREPATQTDHVIPLSRGGSNWPANLRPACGPCNRDKWDRMPSELATLAS